MSLEMPVPQATLGELVSLLRVQAGVELLGPDLPDLTISDWAVLDSQDVARSPTTDEIDVTLLAVTGLHEPGQLVVQLARRRPRAVLLRGRGPSPEPVHLDVPIVMVSEDASWGQIIDTITRFVLDASVRETWSSDDNLGEHTDLFGLAEALGALTSTLISIEDDQGRVLAFSPYSDQADPIRRLTILGREPPSWHIAELRSQKVYDRLRRPRATVELPESAQLKRRMGVGMVELASQTYLGTIWAQETDTPFDASLRDHLVAASLYATRLITQTRMVHNRGTELVHRLLAPEDFATTHRGQQLRIAAPDDFTVVGFEAPSDQHASGWLGSAEAVAILSMQATTQREHAMVAPHDGRLFAILPGAVDLDRDSAWAERTVGILSRHRLAAIRAAVSSSLSAPTVSAARSEIERVCTMTSPRADRPVVMLENERTPVLLAECLRSLPAQELLEDKRFRSLVDYDEIHNVGLLNTVTAWLDRHGDVSATAQAMLTHSNTIRYRLRRAEVVSGYRLDNAEDRLLLGLQVRLWAHTEPANPRPRNPR